MKYFLSIDGKGEAEVSLERYCQAERQCGFRPKDGCGPAATSSFSCGVINGRTEYAENDVLIKTIDQRTGEIIWTEELAHRS